MDINSSMEELMKKINVSVDKVNKALDTALRSEDFAKLKKDLAGTIDLTVKTTKSEFAKFKDQMTTHGSGHSSDSGTSRKSYTYVPTAPRSVHRKFPGSRQPSGFLTFLLMFFGVAGSLSLLISAFPLLPIALDGNVYFIADLIYRVVFAALFAAGACWGFARKRFKTRFKLYASVIGSRDSCSIDILSKSTGYGAGFIYADLVKMIRRRMFGDAYIDPELSVVFFSYDAYMYARTENERLQMKEQVLGKKASEPAAAEASDPAQISKLYLERIRKINDELDEAEISEKLSELERITGQIFRYVSAHPDRMPKIKNFMEYYLPTTLKLVEAYRNLEQHRFSSPDVADTKLEIKAALGNINLAFGNLMGKLLQNDLMDLSTDITAMETMLAQEGLSRGGFEK